MEKLVQAGLALRASLPSAMHPEPLVGVGADGSLNGRCVVLGIGHGVGFFVSCADGGDCRFKADPDDV